MTINPNLSGGVEKMDPLPDLAGSRNGRRRWPSIRTHHSSNPGGRYVASDVISGLKQKKDLTISFVNSTRHDEHSSKRWPPPQSVQSGLALPSPCLEGRPVWLSGPVTRAITNLVANDEPCHVAAETLNVNSTV